MAVLLLGVAVALGVVAYRLASTPVTAPQVVAPPPETPVVQAPVASPPAPPAYDVVVAKRDLPAGEALQADMLTVRQWSAVPEQAFSRADELVGQVLRMPVAKGDAILQPWLARGLATYLSPDFRALAVPIDDVAGIAGAIQPGNVVDVFFTLNKDRDQVDDTQARLLLPSVQVLAWGDQSVDGPIPGTDDSPRRNERKSTSSAVLAIPLEEVGQMLLAMRNGKLHLVLRSPEDTGRPDLELFPKPSPVLAADNRLDDEKKEALQAPANQAYAGVRLSGLAGTDRRVDHAESPTSRSSGPGRRVQVIRGGQVQSIPY